MRVVLDTNVIVSAALTASGPCARILDMALEGAVTLFADDRILGEYDEVLRRPELRLDAADVGDLLEFVRRVAARAISVPVKDALPDADDLPFLEVAAAADAVLVTGNLRHFPRSARAGVTVLKPAEFLEIVRRAS